MSRKSRKHIVEKRRRQFQRHIAVMVLTGLCILVGAVLIWRAAGIVTIVREDAIPVKATFQQAVEQWEPKGFKRYGFQQCGLSLTFSDHDEMEIPYNWDDVAIEKKLRYTDHRRRPVLLADLAVGTVCDILADPQEPNDILHLETEEGTVVVSFEASMEQIERMRENRFVFGSLLICAGTLATLLEMYLYRKQKRTIRR